MISFRLHLRTLTVTVLVSAVTLLTGCAATPQVTPDDDLARGREQMIRALDAAWVRVLADGKIREILDTEPASRPGAANGFVVRMADCLPIPDMTPYPENPVGLLKQVLDSGQIRRLVQDVPSTPGSTSFYFTDLTTRYFEAVLDELGNHYGVKIEYVNVGFPPGSLPSTSALLDDKVDILSQLNATGGSTQDMRRRISRRYTCTMVAASQFIQIPADSPLANEIGSLNDLIDRPDVRICAGPLTTQTVRAFLPDHQIMTRYIDDIADCDARIKAGKSDIMVNPLPDLTIAGVDGYKSVHTLLVAGTPLWVAQEGIVCDIPPDRPRGEPGCREINPP